MARRVDAAALVGGTLLTVALAVPWYWAAERASPGFLDYFLVGEHWKRFVEPGWKGDLYGQAHARPRGTIWVWWLAAALPWSPLAVGWLARTARHAARRRAPAGARPVVRSTCCCGRSRRCCSSPSRATFSPTYVLPGMPAFALLLCEFWRPRHGDARAVRFAVRLMLACGVAAARVFVGVIVIAAAAIRRRAVASRARAHVRDDARQ